MDYLSLFSVHNLALLSDWLEETGELYVDVYRSRSGGGGIAFLIRSLDDLKSLNKTWIEVLRRSQYPKSELTITVIRTLQFPLRGIADEQLLAQALQQIPEAGQYEFIYLRYYPEPANFCGSGRGHAEFRKEFADVLGEMIAIGKEPDVYSGKLISDSDIVFYASAKFEDSQLHIQRNQDHYAPYVDNPERYQWIVELWRE